MSQRVAAWIRQADHDLKHAHDSLAAGGFDWVCYAASQSAEKSLKAALLSLGADSVWGHNLVALLDRVQKMGGMAVAADLMDDARMLTQYNVLARYPMGDEAIAPAELFTRAQAEGAIASAERIREFLRMHVLGS
ncbi:HEPN domain-containing protein [Skermanella mucosa]|uniref:HEPN domain-containing protein n=1 Tax=Skermanella mucosa TaxID=1789672 RepID=UPI00192BFDDE|nr:HEPN domain-containing protein [Skermanella mucosa]UEM19587.1 HEPN domain-containing protein [Skermanella mucosa]